MMDTNKPQEWWTLEEYITYLFASNKTNSPEFKRLMQVFGREKMAEIWEKFRAKKLRNSLTKEAGSDK
jgi:hypothetical protein